MSSLLQTALIQTAIGGIFPILLFSLLFGRIFFKNLEKGKKIIYSTLASYIFGCILSGFGNMNMFTGGTFADFSPYYVEYLISSFFVITARLVIFKIRGK
jgi:hypothetical protein